MPTSIECPSCREPLNIQIEVPAAQSDREAPTSTGVAIVCLHCFVPSLVFDDGSLGSLNLDDLSPVERGELTDIIESARASAAAGYRDWVNIASANAQMPVAALPGLIPAAPVPVYIMNGDVTRPVGHAVAFEVRGNDIWSLLELETSNFSRAMALVDSGATGGASIAAVVITHLAKPVLDAISHRFTSRQQTN